MTAWPEDLHAVPFGFRLLGLGLAFTGIALAERWLRPGRATRALEYPFWLATWLGGGLFGILVDLVTSRLSPAYFVLGKGLPGAGAGEVATLGFEARWAEQVPGTCGQVLTEARGGTSAPCAPRASRRP